MAAEEKKLTPNFDKAPAPAKKKKAKGSNRIAKWFRELRSELKKVVWPTPKQIANNTAVALVIMVVSAVVIWGFDTLADKAVEILISIG